ncbi:MAG: uroporphyrinogen decarboxylase [Crocinitomix sp. MedPE-SWsnd]|nr:MAG: uroporphyrinogen decarboxylase [Crocinitomix sp. MedPE-SWsnd]
MEILGISAIEWVGYLASAAVLISFLMKKMRTLRIVNTLGCALFAFYGVLLDFSWPIIITNVAIMCINFYYLFLVKPISK